MDELWVTDASPLITLAKVDEAQLLESFCRRLLVPEGVATEVLAGPADDPARKLLEQGFGQREETPPVPHRVLEWGLGEGESEVLALALARSSAIAVLDDAAARQCAVALGVPVIGTLGVVVRARRHGLIDSAASVIRALQRAGLRIDSGTVRVSLEQAVGERWEEDPDQGAKNP